MISVGLDVGGTKILGVALSEDGTVLKKARRAASNDGGALVDDLAELYIELAGSGAEEPPLPLGIGVPGLVDRSGTLLFSPNLSGASGAAVRSMVERRLEPLRPIVAVDNDATCAAAGESAFGAGRGRKDVLFVTLGTGIGGGIVSGGRILRGSSNFSGEIGHMVVDPQGPPCGCGRRGCWERYASGSGLGRLARDAALAGQASRVVAIAGGDPDVVRGEHVIQALSEGDGEAARIVEEFAWWLALGLANLTNALDPAVIVIGGGLVTAGEALLEPLRRALHAQVEGSTNRPPVEVLAAGLKEAGGAVGAAVIAFAAAGVELAGAPLASS